MLPVKHSDVPAVTRSFFPGARRSFFCRMKCKSNVQIKEETDSSSSTTSHRRNKKQMGDKKFVTIQSIGYLKSWAPAKIGLESEQESETENDCLSLSCLVAVGRLIEFPNDGMFKPSNTVNNTHRSNSILRNVQFISRHANDGKFLFVDQRATLVLGFLPQELLGTSMYEYFNHSDIASLAESHKIALTTSDKVLTPIYGFRTKDNGFINVQSEWKSFKNPWTRVCIACIKFFFVKNFNYLTNKYDTCLQDIEFLIAKNNVVFSDLRTFENGNQNRNNENNENNRYDFLNQCEYILLKIF
jgi:aryl hydrocarbon receptor nuclear translocator-like protein 1